MYITFTQQELNMTFCELYYSFILCLINEKVSFFRHLNKIDSCYLEVVSTFRTVDKIFDILKHKFEFKVSLFIIKNKINDLLMNPS